MILPPVTIAARPPLLPVPPTLTALQQFTILPDSVDAMPAAFAPFETPLTPRFMMTALAPAFLKRYVIRPTTAYPQPSSVPSKAYLSVPIPFHVLRRISTSAFR